MTERPDTVEKLKEISFEIPPYGVDIFFQNLGKEPCQEKAGYLPYRRDNWYATGSFVISYGDYTGEWLIPDYRWIRELLKEAGYIKKDYYVPFLYGAKPANVLDLYKWYEIKKEISTL